LQLSFKYTGGGKPSTQSFEVGNLSKSLDKKGTILEFNIEWIASNESFTVVEESMKVTPFFPVWNLLSLISFRELLQLKREQSPSLFNSFQWR
jgi:hypothetical protein